MNCLNEHWVTYYNRESGVGPLEGEIRLHDSNQVILRVDTPCEGDDLEILALASAAPDLYVIAKELLAWDGLGGEDDDGLPERMREQLERAIAKAEKVNDGF